MKKGLRSIGMMSLAVLTLASCTSKVSFADFKTKAGEALKKTVEYKTAKVTGSIKSKSDNSKSESGIDADLTVKDRVLTGTSLTDVKGIAYGTILTSFGLGSFTVAENTDWTYYAGGNFKVAYSDKDEDGNKVDASIEWNEYGLVTSVKTSGTGKDSSSFYNLKVTYSK